MHAQYQESVNISASPSRQPYNAEAENQLRQRVALLQAEFAQIDVSHDNVITPDELYNYLSKKSGKPFDKDIAEDIFNQMDKDHDGRITLNEFIRVYVQADEILRSKIVKARQTRDLCKREEEELLLKAQKAKINEQAGGAAQPGIAHLNIRSFHLSPGLSIGGNLNLFVDVYLDRLQVAKTGIVPVTIEGARWEEKFAFEVNNPRSEIRLALLDRSVLSGGNLVGQTIIPISELANQEVHLLQANLISGDNTTLVGQLSLEVQWIYSKAKHYTSLAQRCHETLIKADEDTKDYEIMLQKLHEPFEGLRVVHQTKDIQDRYPGLSTTDQKVVAGINKLVSKIGKPEGSSEGLWVKFLLFVCLVEAVVGVLIMFGRSSFLDTLIPVALLLYIRQGALQDVVSLRIVAFIVLGSIALYDIVWLIIFSEDSGYGESQTLLPGSGLRQWIEFLGIVNVVLKFLVVIGCYMLNIETNAQRRSVKTVVVTRTVEYPAM